MAKGDHTDLFMIFVDSSGVPVPGESTTELTSSDRISQDLLSGFTSGCVFEIDRFTLSAEADNLDETDIRQSIAKDNARPGVVAKGAVNPPPVMTPAQISKEIADRLKKQSGPPVKEISFSRSVDTSSGPLLRNIAVGKGYQSAALIKRKAGGGTLRDQKTEVAGDVYLRIDFDYVLVTQVEWQDDDAEVKEDCKFICRKITIKYRPQLPNGRMGAIISGVWEWTPPK
jgi:type VI protein secretion system component Hcp